MVPKREMEPILGYVTVSNFTVEKGDPPNPKPDGFPNYPIPVILIDRLAISREYQRCGLGKKFLMHIFFTSACAVKDLRIGSVGIVTNAINQDAVDLIRRFVAGACEPYEWDDFESIEEDNPEVKIALHVIWYISRQYPDSIASYCHPDASKEFPKIADALEKGDFSNIDANMAIPLLLENKIPTKINSSEIPRTADTVSKAVATGNRYRTSTSNARKISA
jgi:hypothetical protein